MPGRPRIIAHRGASADAAEHTVAAYRQALDDGADGLECDVRLTRDGALVCVHDRTVDRTSTGRGPVSRLELSDLAELDFTAGTGDAGIVTLARLLQMVQEAPRPLELAIETKHPTRYAGLVESTLVETLRAYDIVGGRHAVRVMSFSQTGLRRIRMLEPSLETVWLARTLSLRLRDGRVPACADVAGPSLAALRSMPELVERVHAGGHEVHVWTVDEPDDLAFARDVGVDALITNRPSAAIAVLDG